MRPFLYRWKDFEKDFYRLHIASAERPNDVGSIQLKSVRNILCPLGVVDH